MKARIYIMMLAAAVAFPMMASAQNLDPTVEVSKAYEGKVMEVNKPLYLPKKLYTCGIKYLPQSA